MRPAVFFLTSQTSSSHEHSMCWTVESKKTAKIPAHNMPGWPLRSQNVVQKHVVPFRYCRTWGIWVIFQWLWEFPFSTYPRGLHTHSVPSDVSDNHTCPMNHPCAETQVLASWVLHQDCGAKPCLAPLLAPSADNSALASRSLDTKTLKL